MGVSEGISVSLYVVRNGNFLKMRVSEICVKRICVNQGLLYSKTVSKKFKCPCR